MESADNLWHPQVEQKKLGSPLCTEQGQSEKNDATQLEGSDESSSKITGPRLWMVQFGLCLCLFLVGLDFTLIATAVPTITSEFHSVQDVSWYGGAFYISLCACTPLAGKLFTLFHKKTIFLFFVAIFEIGSLVCALAPNSRALIIGRVVSGLGAAGIFSGGQVIMITMIPLDKRSLWQGARASTFSVASVIGPVLGGALTQHVSWRWCFYINLPIGGASALMIIIFLHIPEAKPKTLTLLEKLAKVDFLGCGLFLGFSVMLLLSLVWGGQSYAWNSSVIIGLFVGSAGALLCFILQQLWWKDDAFIPPRIFANRNYALIFASGFFSSGSFQVVVYWLPIWFQAVLGVTPTESGVRYIAVVISDVFTGFIGAALMQALGFWNPFLLFGLASISIGSGLLTTLYPSISDGYWIGFEILCGVGYSLIIVMSHMGVQASLSPKDVPIGSTTLLFMLSLSSAVWLSVSQSIFHHQLVSKLAGEFSGETTRQIILTGATQLRVEFGAQQLSKILQVYTDAITDVFYVSAVVPTVAFLLICGATWSPVVQRRKNRMAQGRQAQGEARA